MSDYRNVWALIAAVGFLQLAGGILGVITPLGLQSMNSGPVLVGAIAAAHAAGFMAGAWGSPAMLSLFGNIRLFAASAAVTAATILMQDLFRDPFSWTAIRIIQGASFACMFASIEAWLGYAVPARSRGGVMGLYHVIAKAALLAGPFLIAGLASSGSRAYVVAALFMALALVPVCLTRRGEPPVPDREALTLSALIQLAPSAVAGVFLAGVINTGTLALLPVYAEGVLPGMSATRAAAIAMGAAWAGGLLLQWPAGKLSDKFERRLVIAILAIVSAAAAIAVGLLTGRVSPIYILAALGVWGAGSLCFYGIAVAHAIDRSSPSQIPRVMSGLLFVWAAGSVLGPILSGLSMRTPLGDGGLFLKAGALLIVLALIMLVRTRVREAPADAQHEDWEMAQPTSVANSEIDPRG